MPTKRSKAEATPSTLKTLFALSGNVCAFVDPNGYPPACEEMMTSPDWKRVNGIACHIRGALPESARYDEAMSDGERRHFRNLILLCPKHHKLIDDLEPERFTPELLEHMKEAASLNKPPSEMWATEEELNRAVKLIMSSTEYLVSYGYMQKLDIEPPVPEEFQGGVQTTFAASMGGGASVAHDVVRAAHDESVLDDAATINALPGPSPTDDLFISENTAPIAHIDAESSDAPDSANDETEAPDFGEVVGNELRQRLAKGLNPPPPKTQ